MNIFNLKILRAKNSGTPSGYTSFYSKKVLPTPTKKDNGKVLGVDNAEYKLVDLPKSQEVIVPEPVECECPLPVPTEEDEGKVLVVKDKKYDLDKIEKECDCDSNNILLVNKYISNEYCYEWSYYRFPLENTRALKLDKSTEEIYDAFINGKTVIIKNDYNMWYQGTPYSMVIGMVDAWGDNPPPEGYERYEIITTEDVCDKIIDNGTGLQKLIVMGGDQPEYMSLQNILDIWPDIYIGYDKNNLTKLTEDGITLDDSMNTFYIKCDENIFDQYTFTGDWPHRAYQIDGSTTYPDGTKYISIHRLDEFHTVDSDNIILFQRLNEDDDYYNRYKFHQRYILIPVKYIENNISD